MELDTGQALSEGEGAFEQCHISWTWYIPTLPSELVNLRGSLAAAWQLAAARVCACAVATASAERRTVSRHYGRGLARGAGPRRVSWRPHNSRTGGHQLCGWRPSRGGRGRSPSPLSTIDSSFVFCQLFFAFAVQYLKLNRKFHFTISINEINACKIVRWQDKMCQYWDPLWH